MLDPSWHPPKESPTGPSPPLMPPADRDQREGLRPAPTQWREGPDGPKSGHTNYPISTPTQSRRRAPLAVRSTHRACPDDPLRCQCSNLLDREPQQLAEHILIVLPESGGGLCGLTRTLRQVPRGSDLFIGTYFRMLYHVPEAASV